MELPVVVVEHLGEGGVDAVRVSLSSVATRPRSAIRAFERATGISVVAPVGSSPRAAVSAFVPDSEHTTRVLNIEQTLRRLRSSLEIGDVKSIDEDRAILAFATNSVRAHPQDPECASWSAELLRLSAWSQLLAGDTVGSKALTARANLLDGGRVIGLSERSGSPLLADSAPFTPEASDAPVARLTFTAADLGRESEIAAWVDGRERVGLSWLLPEGEHHVRIVLRLRSATDRMLLGERVLFAKFLPISSSQSIVLQDALAPIPCTEGDLDGANAATFSVRCPRFVRVHVREDHVDVAVCGANMCGPTTTWFAPVTDWAPPRVLPSSGWPAWSYIAIGASVVGAGALTAWGFGAFSRDRPAPVFRWEGVVR